MLVKQFNFLSREDTTQVVNVIKNKRHKVIILLMIDCGLRVTEACSVKYKNFDFKTRTLTIQSLKKRGASSLRSIPISDRLYYSLGEYVATQNSCFNPDNYLFPSHSAVGHLSRKQIWLVLKTIKNKYNIDNLHPHALRHSFATHHLESGTTLPELKEMLGHTNYNTTLIYAEIPTEQLRARINAVSSVPLSIWQKLYFWLIPQPKAKLINIDFRENYFTIGRNEELNAINSAISKGINTLIIGKIGVGKSHLLKNIETDKKVLRLDETDNIKKSLASILLMIYADKETVLSVLWKDFDKEEIDKKIQRENIVSLCDTIKASLKPLDYVLIIDDISSITPTAKKAIERLKDTFIIIAGARAVKASDTSFLWNFEKMEIKNLSRKYAFNLINQMMSSLEVENKELFRNHLFDQTNGNPRAITELIQRYQKEPFLDTQTIREIKHTGALPEIDMTWLITVFLGLLTCMRFLAREVDNTSLRFVGSCAMIVLLLFRPLISKMKRNYI